jgi:2-polyprenyl-3-methyl-5-hydroxy-6-metoxy-1,4-benzoquinol methylase
MNYLLTNTELRPINDTMNSLFSYINKYKSLNKMRVLEIGIGNGNSSIPMSAKFKSYYGIEPLTHIYDVFVKSCKKHNCNIKSYNMDLEKFVNTTNKKFDLIILRNVIQFIGHNELIKQCKKIVKKNAFIIIQNAKAEPVNWGDKELNKDSAEFNEIKWLKYKNLLETHYSSLLNSKYFDKFDKDERYVFYVLKMG